MDDWVALLQQSDQALKAVQAIQCISGKLGMILSLKKSTIFATKAKLTNTIQGQLAQHGLALGTIRNPTGLGINFQTMGQPSPEMRDKRWGSAKILLERLQYMPWTTHRKTQILTRGIFPLLFYGCHTWRSGKEFLWEVRAKCNHAVWGKKQYHLHYLAPLFSGQDYEPATYVARQRFAALLRLYLSHPDMVKQVWDQSIHAKAFYKGKTRGTISLFQHQLNDLGWAMKPGGECETTQGWRFNIWNITTSQFLERVTESWEYSIQQHLRTKMHLEDMETFSASFSQYPTQADPMLEGFMRKVRLGGMFPYRRRNHVTQEDLACPFCGQEDTLAHRAYECVGTEHLRSGPLWSTVEAQSRAQVLGGLFGAPLTLPKFTDALEQLEPPEIYKLPDKDQRRHFFTDGSAFQTGHQKAMVCSWAVTEASDDSNTNVVRAGGILVGMRQTVFRSELHAINAAILLSDCATIYSDNKAAVKRTQQILAGKLSQTLLFQHPDRDLLMTTQKILAGRSPGSIRVVWVKSHRQLYEATGCFDLWCIYHNQKADEAAKSFGKTLPESVSQAQKELVADISARLKAKEASARYLRWVMDEFLE